MVEAVVVLETSRNARRWVKLNCATMPRIWGIQSGYQATTAPHRAVALQASNVRVLFVAFSR